MGHALASNVVSVTARSAGLHAVVGGVLSPVAKRTVGHASARDRIAEQSRRAQGRALSFTGCWIGVSASD